MFVVLVYTIFLLLLLASLAVCGTVPDKEQIGWLDAELPTTIVPQATGVWSGQLLHATTKL